MRLRLFIVSLCLLAVSNVTAQQSSSAPLFQPGIHFLEFASKNSESELTLDFYFYPESLASYQLDIALSQVKQRHPDLTINKIPYIHDHTWRKFAKIYYISESLNIADQVLSELYGAIHELGIKFERPEDFVEQLPSLAPHAEQVLEQYTSRLINDQIRAQQKIIADLPVKGVPSIILNKRYLVDASMAQSTNQLVAILNQLMAN